MTIYLFVLHIVEMAVWAAFCVAVALLPACWKYLSAAEGVTGLLMFAGSTGVMFNQTSWVTEARRKYLREHRTSWTKEPAAPPSS